MPARVSCFLCLCRRCVIQCSVPQSPIDSPCRQEPESGSGLPQRRATISKVGDSSNLPSSCLFVTCFNCFGGKGAAPVWHRRTQSTLGQHRWCVWWVCRLHSADLPANCPCKRGQQVLKFVAAHLLYSTSSRTKWTGTRAAQHIWARTCRMHGRR
jgi:hypothetical protein